MTESEVNKIEAWIHVDNDGIPRIMIRHYENKPEAVQQLLGVAIRNARGKIRKVQGHSALTISEEIEATSTYEI